MKIFPMIIGVLSLTTIQINGFCKEAVKNDITLGAELWANNCARCHNLRPSLEYPKESWQTIMMHMRLQAGLTGQETRDVLEFLVPEFVISPEPAAASSVKNPATKGTMENTDHVVKNAKNTNMMVTQKNVKSSENTLENQKNAQEKSLASQSTSKRSGREIYLQSCVACHGQNGKGAIPGVPDWTQPNGPLSQSNATLLKHIKEGFQKPGDPMAMPPKGGNPNLTDEDIKNVLDYILRLPKS
jgi:mono/diheme cytochrome c family protein